jgi:SAM-dependent methyltransferase
MWCSKCALGRLAGKFSGEEIKKFFDIPYYTHGSKQLSESERFAKLLNQSEKSFLERLIIHLAWRFDQGTDLMPDEVGPASNRTLCDLGCGDGQNLKRFSDAGFHVVGVEPDPVARAHANQFAQVFDGTVEVLPSEVSCKLFDVLLLSHVLDVCTDLKKSIANIRSILSSSGTLIVEVPNFAARGFQIYGPEWPWTDIPRHLTFFTEKSLRLILETSGFAVKKVQYLGYTRQFSPGWRTTQATIRQIIGSDDCRTVPPYLWLAQTAFASKARKYDSVRVLAAAA